jgi:hypothetical protein
MITTPRVRGGDGLGQSKLDRSTVRDEELAGTRGQFLGVGPTSQDNEKEKGISR